MVLTWPFSLLLGSRTLADPKFATLWSIAKEMVSRYEQWQGYLATAQAIFIFHSVCDPLGWGSCYWREFLNYSNEERNQHLESISILVRSSPSNKLLMVRTLNKIGLVVVIGTVLMMHWQFKNLMLVSPLASKAQKLQMRVQTLWLWMTILH